MECNRTYFEEINLNLKITTEFNVSVKILREQTNSLKILIFEQNKICNSAVCWVVTNTVYVILRKPLTFLGAYCLHP
jgi:hypothetical protein